MVWGEAGARRALAVWACAWMGVCFGESEVAGGAICGRRCARCVREGAVMDAGNSIGPEGVASFMAALEKMPQLRVYAALVGFVADFGLLID